MITVYLGKSNRANPEVVSHVRKLLVQADFEIHEFKGGYYDVNPVIDCDFYICIPDREYDEKSNQISLGKGLNDQINHRIRINKPILIIGNNEVLNTTSIIQSLTKGCLKYPMVYPEQNDTASYSDYSKVKTLNYSSTNILTALSNSLCLFDKSNPNRKGYIMKHLELIRIKEFNRIKSNVVINQSELVNKEKTDNEKSENMMLLLLRK